MRSVFYLFSLTFPLLFIGCVKDKSGINSELNGKWKLVAEMMDGAIIIGEPYGVFVPIQSNKEIEFFGNGTFASNGTICGLSNQSGNPEEGTFSLANSTLTPSSCSLFNPNSIEFSIELDTLIITYPCFESCAYKYQRI